MTTPEQTRWKVVQQYEDEMQRLPSGSKPRMIDVAKAVGVSRKVAARWVKRYQQQGNVANLPSPGRKPIMNKEAIAAAVAIVEQQDIRNCDVVAQQLAEGHQVQVSGRTMRRQLQRVGMAYQPPKRVRIISAANKLKRVAFAQQAISKRVRWGGVMITDSKYFLLQPTHERLVQYWGWKGQRRTRPTARNSMSLHVYGGVTKYGTSSLHYATGTTGQQSKYLYTAGGSKGAPMRGVGHEEYIDVLDTTLLPAAEMLFKGTCWQDKWVFQQDNAPAHKHNKTMAHLTERGARVMAWPANSPDLSWIENVWGWVDRKLRKKPLFNDVDHFKSALNAAWQSIPPAHLRNYVKDMYARMDEVVAAAGAPIER